MTDDTKRSDLSVAIDELSVTALRVKAERDRLRESNSELVRALGGWVESCDADIAAGIELTNSMWLDPARAAIAKALDVATDSDRPHTQSDELQRRLTEILDMIDGYEDIDGVGGPNVFMRIAMTARGEDRP